MNLIIDVGNSFVKVAVFQLDNLVFKDVFQISRFQEKNIEILKKHPDLVNCMMSSVGKLTEKDVLFLKKHFDLTILSKETSLPFVNDYKTPETLGVDRLALMSAVIGHKKTGNFLVIDAGTCITYDFMTSDYHYLGGAISPGIKMRFKALHAFTAALPLIEEQHEVDVVGYDTLTCMQSGCVNGVLFEIEGVINSYKAKYQDLTVILTGGDANFLSKQLKSSIFANSNFLLEGLNYLLNYNRQQ